MTGYERLASHEATAQPVRSLVPRLGAIDGVALVISNIVGTGIFVTPGIVFGYLPHPLLFLGIWFVGGLLALAGALSYTDPAPAASTSI